jgi:hypothetical protein
MLNKIDINKYYKSPHFSSFLGLKKIILLKNAEQFQIYPQCIYVMTTLELSKTLCPYMVVAGFTKLRKGGGGKKLNSL